MVEILVDGRIKQAKEETILLSALLDLGYDIPHLCHHSALSPWGGCRLCIVKVNGSKRPVASCTVKVKKGMEIITEDKELFHIRKTLLRLLAASSPKAKGLSAWMERYGAHEDPFPKRDRDNSCVLCARCTRVCNEVLGKGAIDLCFRSVETKVSTFFAEPSADCMGCRACETICPTGAIKGIIQGATLRLKGLYDTEVSLARCDMCGEPFSSEKIIKELGLNEQKICPNCKRKLLAKNIIYGSKYPISH